MSLPMKIREMLEEITKSACVHQIRFHRLFISRGILVFMLRGWKVKYSVCICELHSYVFLWQIMWTAASSTWLSSSPSRSAASSSASSSSSATSGEKRADTNFFYIYIYCTERDALSSRCVASPRQVQAPGVAAALQHRPGAGGDVHTARGVPEGPDRALPQHRLWLWLRTPSAG